MKTSICSSLKGFVAKGKKKMVCKLIRSLYGLKQVSQEWYYEFDTFTQSQGFCRSQVESLLVHQKGSLIILVLYIDMLIAGRDTHAMNSLKQILHASFDMKDLGDVNHILACKHSEIGLKDNSFYLNRSILQCSDMERWKTMVSIASICETRCRRQPYIRWWEGWNGQDSICFNCILWLLYVLALLFQWERLAGTWQSLAKSIEKAVKSIKRYLKGTKDLCICFEKQKASDVGFTSADYTGHHLSYRKFTSECVYLHRGAVSWISRLHKCSALPTTVAEYVAASEACKEAQSCLLDIWAT